MSEGLSPWPWRVVIDAIRDNDGIAVAMAPMLAFPVPWDANARLMAAAPELLEALADLLGWDNCECGHPACERGKAAGEARALIARIRS